MSFFESSPKRPRLLNHSDDDENEEATYHKPNRPSSPRSHEFNRENSGKIFSSSYGTSSESEYSSTSDKEGDLHKMSRHESMVKPSFFIKGGNAKGFSSNKASFKSKIKTSQANNSSLAAPISPSKINSIESTKAASLESFHRKTSDAQPETSNHGGPSTKPQVLPSQAPVRINYDSFDTTPLQTKLHALESQLPSYRQQMIQRRYSLGLLLASLYTDVLNCNIEEKLSTLERRMQEAKEAYGASRSNEVTYNLA